MMKNRLMENDCIKGYILDGFPRTIVQAGRKHVRAYLKLVRAQSALQDFVKKNYYFR